MPCLYILGNDELLKTSVREKSRERHSTPIYSARPARCPLLPLVICQIWLLVRFTIQCCYLDEPRKCGGEKVPVGGKIWDLYGIK